MSPNKDKQIKYYETSEEVFKYLMRYFFVSSTFLSGGKFKFIKIKGRMILLKGKKNYIKERLYDILEIKFPKIEKPVIMKTIKNYLNLFYQDLEK